MTAIQTDSEIQALEATRLADRKASDRIVAYLSVGAGLTIFYAYMRGSAWHGGATLHTVMEAVSTILAFTVGAMALVRYYSKKNNTFLFIGAGFLGTAFLDGYHALVTSAAFKPLMPTELPHLIPWSWVASRQFLSVLMFLSWFAWLREQRTGRSGQISEVSVYMLTGVFTLLSFTFFAFAPLPRAYYPEFVFHRPEEFLPALFFLAALIGYVLKGHWRHDIFEHWLVLSLITGLASQAVFMSFSGALFDLEFDAAHFLKKVSYVCVLTGLLGGMYVAFRQEAKFGSVMAKSRERAEVTLAELASQKMAMDEHSIVAVTDTSGTITYANDKFCQISKFDRGELIGANHRIVKSDHHPEEFFTDMYKTVANGQHWHGEIKNRAKDGTHYWVDTTIAPFKDLNGKVVQYVAVRTDITHQKQTLDDLANSNEDLQRANSDLKRFAYVASHDLQEPLRKLQQFSDFLAKDCAGQLSEDGTYFLDVIQGSSSRMSHLIRDLLAYSRTSNRELEPREVDLSVLTNGILSELDISISESKANIQVDDLPTIVGDPGSIQHLIQNLISNAIKYRDPERDPKIRISSHVSSVDGALEIRVADNGIGFDMKFCERIFEPFQRLHNKHEFSGSGIGLAVCNTICERHGWKLNANSETGKGSTFSVIIPSIDTP